MYSVGEKRRKRKYLKIASSAQNEQISCKKWSFSLLFSTNPLPLTILNNVSMKVVAIGGLLSLTIGRQQTIIMVISFDFHDSWIWMGKFEFQIKLAGAQFEKRKNEKLQNDQEWLYVHLLYFVLFRMQTLVCTPSFFYFILYCTGR
jgi:hypothetical protein